MNVYDEAKDHFGALLDNYEGSNKASVTLSELVDDDGHCTEYVYSVYNSTLFEAISDDLRLLGYAEDIEKEFDTGIATNPMLINEAIFRYMLDEYGNKTADYFDIEVEDEEEEEEEEDEEDEEEESAEAERE